MKKLTHNLLTDPEFVERIKEIMRQDNFLLGIGDIARATGVSQRKLRYWEQRGYIKAAKCADNHQHRKYSYYTMARISLIKSYLDSGFTLKAAVEKTQAHDQAAAAIHKLFKERISGVRRLTDGYEFDLGALKEQPDTHVVAIIKQAQPTCLLLKKDHH
ncbi:MerR family transcriptional regulator [Liquorilactobacillus sicerae]|uniref:MerR family transcriptional regulator n=1 Tax=Liquorilactobacillus sicerae TaxID=1416943 RepID=UPI0024813FF3|nr:MerR family transcriptional regulator [Liquorilactobacillus sicerae]